MSYVGSARQMARSGTLEVPFAPWDFDRPSQPLTRFPPLFPAVLASFERSGIDAVVADRVLNGVAGGFSLALSLALSFGLLSATKAPCSWIGLSAASLILLVAFSGRSLGYVHLWVWSEPIFLAGFLLFAAALPRPSQAFSSARAALWALLAGILAGLECLAKYAGFGLFPVGFLVLLFGNRKRPIAARAGLVLCFCTGFALTYGPWFLHLQNLGAANGSRSLGFYPAQFVNVLSEQIEALGTWLLPPSAPPQVTRLCGAAAFVVLGAFLFTELRRSLLSLVALAYAAFLLVASIVSSPAVSGDRDGRLFSPLFLGVAVSLAAFFRSGQPPRAAWKTAIGLASAIVFLSGAYRAIPRIHQAATWGVGYEARNWRASALLYWVRTDGSRYSALYTDNPAALYFGTGRLSYLPLDKWDAASVLAFREKFRKVPSLFVSIQEFSGPASPSRDQFIEAAGLVRERVFAEGAVYGAR